MSSIALGMQVNGLEARIVALELRLAALDPGDDTAMRLAKLESDAAMMRHAIDAASLGLPVKVKATRA
jgi:uncharacterized coiled-coil protein SlyX